jgi:aromatic ring-opening dioxygenase LigB subunit
MLISAYLVPHSPVLIPSIGKENRKIIKETVSAYEEIAEKIKKDKIDTLFIISPHGQNGQDFFCLNAPEKYLIDFKNFGDLGTKKEIKTNSSLAFRLKNSISDKKKIRIIAQQNLDYSSGIPLFLISQINPKIQALVLSRSELNLFDHFSFGTEIQNILSSNPKRIAIVASGDLSHRLKRTSQAGYSIKGAKFDNRIIEILNKGSEDWKQILEIDGKLIQEAQECGLKSLAVLLGAIKSLPFSGKFLSYEKDLGIGYLCFEFSLLSPA